MEKTTQVGKEIRPSITQSICGLEEIGDNPSFVNFVELQNHLKKLVKIILTGV